MERIHQLTERHGTIVDCQIQHSTGMSMAVIDFKDEDEAYSCVSHLWTLEKKFGFRAEQVEAKPPAAHRGKRNFCGLGMFVLVIQFCRQNSNRLIDRRSFKKLYKKY